MRSAAVSLLKFVIATGSGNTTRRCALPLLLVCAAIGVACGKEKLFEPTALTRLDVTPAGASALQGGSVTVAVTLTRSGGFTGAVNLTVTGLPAGVDAVVSSVQGTGLKTTATVTLHVGDSTIPGAYSLVVHGTGTGVTEATAAFALTVEPVPSCQPGVVCEQWAASATASSQYTASDWSANQATGQPNVAGSGCTDDVSAWASLESGGVEWLELVYRESVRPTEIRIHEVLGVSSIVKVEVKDAAGTYQTVYTAQPGSQTCPRVLTIPVTGISAMVKVVRVSFDQRPLDNWDEIDAVKLIGDGQMESNAALVGPPSLATNIVRDGVWSEPINVGAPINSPFLEQSPFLTDHGRSLYFSSNRPGATGSATDLWVSHRSCDGCPWETPINLGPALNTTNGEAGPSLSVDGHLLFFNSARATGRGMNDIYMSWRSDPNDDQGWEAPILLDTEVNTAGFEHTPFYVQTGADAGTLYFTRGVANGVSNDIWKVEINREGETLSPAVLVSELSQAATNDAMATFSANGKEVIFASDRPPPHVGFQFWSATRQSAKGSWSEPVVIAQLGAAIHPNLSFDGRTLHFTSARIGTLGGQDIWMSTRAQRDP